MALTRQRGMRCDQQRKKLQVMKRELLQEQVFSEQRLHNIKAKTHLLSRETDELDDYAKRFIRERRRHLLNIARQKTTSTYTDSENDSALKELLGLSGPNEYPRQLPINSYPMGIQSAKHSAHMCTENEQATNNNKEDYKYSIPSSNRKRLDDEETVDSFLSRINESSPDIPVKEDDKLKIDQSNKNVPLGQNILSRYGFSGEKTNIEQNSAELQQSKLINNTMKPEISNKPNAYLLELQRAVENSQSPSKHSLKRAISKNSAHQPVITKEDDNKIANSTTVRTNIKPSTSEDMEPTSDNAEKQKFPASKVNTEEIVHQKENKTKLSNNNTLYSNNSGNSNNDNLKKTVESDYDVPPIKLSSPLHNGQQKPIYKQKVISQEAHMKSTAYSPVKTLSDSSAYKKLLGIAGNKPESKEDAIKNGELEESKLAMNPEDTDSIDSVEAAIEAAMKNKGVPDATVKSVPIINPENSSSSNKSSISPLEKKPIISSANKPLKFNLESDSESYNLSVGAASDDESDFYG